MYSRVERQSFIYEGKIIIPVASLRDDFGGWCHVALDDHCYVIYVWHPIDSKFKTTTHIFKEVFNVLKVLKEPR